MKDVVNFLESLNISDDELVVLACSYGPDSMCLLNLLLDCNFNVVVAHVNHMVREESFEEYRLMKEYCEERDVKFEYYQFENKITKNFEATARLKRYNFFEEVLTKYHSRYLFTAHHGDDLVETVLMRLSRGASFRGYAGFREISDFRGKFLVRPLLFVTKDDINKFNSERNIPSSFDYTNADKSFTRNRYRLDVLPILKDINPKIHKKFIKFSHTISEYDDYVENEVKILYSRLYSFNRLDLNEFDVLPLLLKKRLLCEIFSNLYNGEIININDKHLNLIFNLIDSKSCGQVNLPKKIMVVKYYNILEFRVNDAGLKKFDYIFEDKVMLPFGYIEKLSEDINSKSNYIIRLSSREISLPLHVRSRCDGDIMFVKNLNGSKKIKNILIDEKVPSDKRDGVPVVTDSDGKILWIAGVKKSKFDKQSNEYYDIILRYVKKEKEFDEE